MTTIAPPELQLDGCLAAALAYAARGWPVVPLHGIRGGKCSCGEAACDHPGKHPRTQHGLKEATRDAETIGGWWSKWPNANVAILTGAESGFFALDVDPRHGGDVALEALEDLHGRLPPTVESLTGGGGRHLLFTHPGGTIKSRADALGPGVDVKAAGGYLTAPPSLHISGKRYTWEASSTPDDQAVADCPAWLLEKLQQEKPSSAKPPAGDGDDRILEGRRNEALLSLAGKLRRAGMEQEEIQAALLTVNSKRCKPPLAETEVGIIAKSVTRYPAGRALTDIGLAERLVDRAGADLRYCGPLGKWLIWTGKFWRPADAFEISPYAKDAVLSLFEEARKEPDELRQKALAKFAVASQRRERLAAAMDLARADLKVAPAELDVDPWLFNVANGTLNLKSGLLEPHRREHLITKAAPVTFDASAACPLWDSFLDRIMAGQSALIAYLQRLFGMSLTADVSEQCLFIAYGRGANGKSVLLDSLAGLMGDYAAEAAPDLLVLRRHQEHPTELADLCGKRLVVASETEESGRLRVQLIKRLTGNRKIKARFVCRDFFEFARTHKLILVTNNKPVVRESTNAIRRRLRLIPFTVVIPDPEQDKNLLAKLDSERPGILNWLIAGCLAWQRHGLQTPAEVEAATTTFLAEQDPLVDFLVERCLLAANAFVPRTELYALYQAWANKANERFPLDRNAFYERLRTCPGVADAMRRIEGKPTKGFSGIGVAAPTLEEAGFGS